jgi:hypothetical protein
MAAADTLLKAQSQQKPLEIGVPDVGIGPAAQYLHQSFLESRHVWLSLIAPLPEISILSASGAKEVIGGRERNQAAARCRGGSPQAKS